MSIDLYVRFNGNEVPVEMGARDTTRDVCKKASAALGVPVVGLKLDGVEVDDVAQLVQDDVLEAVGSEVARGRGVLEELGGEISSVDLRSAVKAGNLERVEAYLCAGYEPSHTPLALREKHLDVYELLLAHGGWRNYNFRHDYFQLDPPLALQAAEILCRYADPNQPLEDVCPSEVSPAVVTVFLDAGFRLRLKYWSYIWAEQFIRCGDPDALDLILRTCGVGVARLRVDTPLHHAVRSKRPLDMVKVLMTHGYKVKAADKAAPYTPLSAACEVDHASDANLEVIKYLIEECGFRLTHKDVFRAAHSLRKVRELLHVYNASSGGVLLAVAEKVSEAEFLQAVGFVPSCICPLTVYCKHYRGTTGVRALLDKGFTEGLATGEAYKTAIDRGHFKQALELLVRAREAEFNTEGLANYTQKSGMKLAVVHVMANELQHELLEVLFEEFGGDGGVVDAGGRTPMDYAVRGAMQVSPHRLKTIEVLWRWRKDTAKGKRGKKPHQAVSPRQWFEQIVAARQPRHLKRTWPDVDDEMYCDHYWYLEDYPWWGTPLGEWDKWDELYEEHESKGIAGTKKMKIKKKGMGRKYGGGKSSQQHKFQRELCYACWKTENCRCKYDAIRAQKEEQALVERYTHVAKNI